jgi:hypothetical protein
MLAGESAGFGTLSSQSGSDARYLGRQSQDWRPFFLFSPSKLGDDIGAAVFYLIIKAAISGVLVAAISEVARRYPGWGGLLASLPLTSLLAMIWLYRDSGDAQRVADLAGSTFWFIIPSLPLFLVLPALIRSGMAFWLALAVSVAGTLLLYALFFWAAPRIGIRL